MFFAMTLLSPGSTALHAQGAEMNSVDTTANNLVNTFEAPHSFTPSLPHSLPHLLTHNAHSLTRTPSFTHSPTPSLTHSLTHAAVACDFLTSCSRVLQLLQKRGGCKSMWGTSKIVRHLQLKALASSPCSGLPSPTTRAHTSNSPMHKANI